MRLRLAPLLSLVFVACPLPEGGKDGDDDDDGGSGVGSVEIDALSDFGGVESAVWLHYSRDGHENEEIVVSNVRSLCSKIAVFVEAEADYSDEIEDIDPEDFCADARDATLAFADAASELYFDGAHYVVAGPMEDVALAEGIYGVGSAEDNFGVVLAYTADPYGRYEDWDEDADYTDDPYCGMGEPGDVEDHWDFASGELVIDSISDETTAEGSLEGELLDEDDDADGSIYATFAATWCEVDWD